MAKIHLKNVIFSFTPIKIELYTIKVPMKSKKKFVLQVSLKMNLNMQMSYTLIEYPQNTPK